MVRVYFYIVEKFAMWRTIQPYVEHVKKQPYSPGRARFLQHTSFNINYFLIVIYCGIYSLTDEQ